MRVDWATLKAFVLSRGLSIQFVETSTLYIMVAFDGPFKLECELSKSASDTTELTDFETNFKPNGNKAIVPASPAFAAKVLPNGKKLFARNTGLQAAVTTGSNVVTYTATYPWVKLLGAEVIGGETLDYIDFEVYDTPEGTYSGYPNAKLNQFGYSVNISKDLYRREAPYDADVYVGMVLKMTYNSVSDKTIGINLIMNEVK